MSVSLADFRGRDVLLRFKAKNGKNSDLYINRIDVSSEWLSGIAEQTAADEQYAFMAYPNPTNGMVSVVLPEDKHGSTISVYDVYGRKLRSFEMSSAGSQLDLTDCSDGVYFMRVEGTNLQTKIVLLKK